MLVEQVDEEKTQMLTVTHGTKVEITKCKMTENAICCHKIDKIIGIFKYGKVVKMVHWSICV